MRDYLGNEIAVGDYVIFMYPNYRMLSLGKIIKLTDKRVRLTHKHHQRENDEKEFLTEPDMVVKINPEDVAKHLLING